MKTLFLTIVCFFVATAAYAADVVITITIPDAQVARVAAMVNADLNCGDLKPQDCLKRELVRHIKYLVKTYEAGLIIKASNDDVKAIEDVDIAAPEPTPEPPEEPK